MLRRFTALSSALAACLVAPLAWAQAAPPPDPQRPPLVAPSAAPASAPAPSPASPPAPTPAPVPAPVPAAAPNPTRDAQDLAAQGAARPAAAGETAGNPREVFSDDWWGRARPIIEIHGYFRTRAELFHDFFLGRHSSSTQGNDPQYLWPIPLDQSYSEISSSSPGTQHSVPFCGPQGKQNCYDKTQSGANLRLRLNPEIHVSDNLRVMTQVDALDNLVLGSTPDSYAMQPASSQSSSGNSGATTKYPTGYQPAGYNGYAPLGAFATTQGPPTAGVNGYRNSIDVKRAWGEYMTPVGQVRFGRMPSHWGLGMLANSGDGIDSDYQSTADRIMFITGAKSIDLYFGGAWDFVSTGPTSASPYDVYGGQPYNTCNLCNVNEWVAFLAHRTNPDLQKLALARGDFVLNGGVYTVFRSQNIDLAPGNAPQTTNYATDDHGLEPRQAYALVPDAWVQAMWRKLRVEAEAVSIYGQLGYVTGLSTDTTKPVPIREYGITTQTEYRAVEDKLDLQFGFGWASGDPWAQNAGFGALNPAPNGLQAEANTPPGPISTFRFHQDYRVDLIFFRHILGRVEGAYYFRPSVDYDFLRRPNGEKFGGGAAVIWSRASEFVQAPGHRRDLGVELDLQLYYQSKDGSLNDDPSKIGGFFTMLQYGVFFPLGGLNYLPGLQSAAQSTGAVPDPSVSAAQTVRLFLGVVY